MRLVPPRRTKVIFTSRFKQLPRQCPPQTIQAVELASSDTPSGDQYAMNPTATIHPGLSQSQPPSGHAAVPHLYANPSSVKDDLITETSITQDQTVQSCLPLLAGAVPGKTAFDYTPQGVARLDRESHIDYLKEHIDCAKYMAFDASKPWVIYWCLTALSLLGEDIDEYRQRCEWTSYHPTDC